MNIIIGWVLFLIFAFLSAIHFYWGLGGEWGSAATIPTKENNVKMLQPTLFSCLVVATGLLAIATFILIKVQVLSIWLPQWFVANGLWLIAGVFMLRAIGEFKYVGFFKKVRKTAFGLNDTKFYSPLCLLIGLLMMIIQLNK